LFTYPAFIPASPELKLKISDKELHETMHNEAINSKIGFINLLVILSRVVMEEIKQL
jgi:hypothetical protein